MEPISRVQFSPGTHFIMNIWNNQNLIDALKNGGTAVMPTDTLYGIVGSALDQGVVEKIYVLRKRQPSKPCIVLIADEEELQKFSIEFSLEQKQEIEKYWPGPVSIILECLDPKFEYLHRGTNALAFRMPAKEELRELLRQTGPLIAPSANQEGMLPAQNIAEAEAYFGDAVDFYLDGGEVTGQPSKILKIERDGMVSVIRS